MSSEAAEVRDPLHGAIEVSRGELSVLDHALFQRLRHIKQLGFSDLSFPGATHNRYLHSIGAMHLAGRAFDAIVARSPEAAIPPGRRAELRRLLRIAALLHDAGHPPFSHASEFAMPRLADLRVPIYEEHAERYPPGRQATHEDFTIKVISDSSMSPLVEKATGGPALAVAGLVDPMLPVDAACYEAGGIDWRPLLQQLISSELDVDRMDYLARDSHFAGVHYGVFDVGWLMNNLSTWMVDGRAHLALQSRAIYAFDDFLIARYHMFLMVYFHYRSVAYEEMLKRWFRDGADGYGLPVDIELYADVDDNQLTSCLRASRNEWARRIVERREYKLLLEQHGDPDDVDLRPVLSRLQEAGIPNFTAESKGVLSKYFSKRRARRGPQPPLPLQGGSVASLPLAPPAIWVLQQPYRGASTTRASELENSTDLFDRYARQLLMSRVYVPAEKVAEAGAAVAGVV